MKADLPARTRATLRRAWPDMLPLPEESRKRLSLAHHLQLEALRAGAGSLMAL